MSIFNKKDKNAQEEALTIKNRLNINSDVSDRSIPDALKPDNIKALLNRQDFDNAKRVYIKKRRKKIMSRTAIALVASFIFVFGIGNLKPSMFIKALEFTPSATDYNQVYNAINRSKYNLDTSVFNVLTNNKNNKSIDLATGETSTMKADSSANTFSSTNEQVLDVYEGDVVKTDGKHIYALSSNGNINILKPLDNGKLKNINTISLDKTNTNSIIEFFIYDNKLILLSANEADVLTTIYTLDVNFDVSATFSYSQSGYYLTSRLTMDGFYVITNQYIYENISTNEHKDYIPITTIMETQKLIEPSDICILPFTDSPSYTIVTGYDLKLNDTSVNTLSNKAILGNDNSLYCSTESLYIVGYNYTKGVSTVTKMGLDNGKLSIDSSNSFEGRVLNQFSMDEFNDTFRIASTKTTVDKQITTTKNILTVFDSNLKKLSSLDDLAKNESIQSVRFVEDFAYIVTFYKTDPLFAIDLSNPSNPKIRDELKIPGLSNYLHPISSNLLLGVGKDADNNGTITGFKISLFDISSKDNIKESDTFLIKGEMSDSLVNYEHKAFFYDKNRSIIALPVISENKNIGNNGILLLDVVNNNLKFNTFIEAAPYEDTYGYGYNVTRTFYINNIFYTYNHDSISSYDYNSFDYLETIKLQ